MGLRSLFTQGQGMIHDRQVQTMIGTEVLDKEQNAWMDVEVKTRSRSREGQTHLSFGRAAQWGGLVKSRTFQNQALVTHCIWESIVCRCM